MPLTTRSLIRRRARGLLLIAAFTALLALLLPAEVSLAAICADSFGFAPKIDYSTGSHPSSVVIG